MMNPSIVDISHLRFSWDKNAHPETVDTLDIEKLSIVRGEHLFIKGKSGSGKTTLLNLLTGIIKPLSGKINILGNDLSELSARQLDQFRVDHLGVIFQQFNLLTYLNLIENVQLPCWFSKKRMSRADDLYQTCCRLLNELQIPEKLHNQSVNNLSVGQQQRVAVARALIGRPEIIIADEPTSALDNDNRLRFIELLFEEADQQQSTIIFVSHDPYLAQYFSRVIEMSDINRAKIN